MRLEYNPRLLCYNLYCDTVEEIAKLKQMMERPITVSDFKSTTIYADTDSIKEMKTKLNAVYGKVATDMTKDYIVVHRHKESTIIFKKFIMAVEKDDEERASIFCMGNVYFYVDEKYADVIKQLV